MLAGRVILLSATPVVNMVDDYRNMAGIMKGLDPEWTNYYFNSSSKALSQIEKNRVAFKPDEEYSVSVLNMPRVIHMREDIVMPPGAKVSVKDIGTGQHSDAFFNRTRRAVNRGAKETWLQEFAQKLIETADEDEEAPAKFIVYSCWLKEGGHLIAAVLERVGIKFEVIDGSKSAKERSKTVTRFNSGKISCIVLSAAGSEGIDLVGAEHVVLYEGYWNDARLEQAKARAVRVNSHQHLPAHRQVVRVHNLVARTRLRSASEIHDMENKADLNDDLLNDADGDEVTDRIRHHKRRKIASAHSK
jgi:hypothetical protein